MKAWATVRVYTFSINETTSSFLCTRAQRDAILMRLQVRSPLAIVADDGVNPFSGEFPSTTLAKFLSLELVAALLSPDEVRYIVECLTLPKRERALKSPPVSVDMRRRMEEIRVARYKAQAFRGQHVDMNATSPKEVTQKEAK